ncbi:MAG TPA: alkene reductase [Cyanobacteria bacterium UBA11149]|nr:alkene reductase [Cyanobacteria bacterium UBA11367]HBE59329.1 alkene reductase [Cyanobacteria bacterium UBA11366]HBK63497.1 alkene reductase [Cyanobacteria bacterium UBA11166]HBR77126.1 alkene reductase [Cyanobacteria bacterium UBA11159]HBS72466.1 alkene reductase [Cyanobacteria bacterium UBA11153]HBW91858.1 alkene reductase [Cyanobacteria bacterium UBA11149]HCA96857.1 alkene reductase [Cyanobacteria bacterium UBA9226]
MSSSIDLFSSIELGENLLQNRIIMAPMTRLRAIDSIPTPLMAQYYAQRATAGLIITECTMVSPLSNGYMNCPGIYNDRQIAGWQKVTEAVHREGGKIFLQLWHSGRVSHSSLLDGQMPVAPSAIAAIGSLHTPIGKVNLEVPRPLATEEIPEIVQQFCQGAENAKEAGFDGVELHGAFGYLIDQFLQDGANQRTDKYGGSIENRARFLLEVVTGVTEVWGGNRVGIKLSPSNTFYGMFDSNPQGTFGYVLAALNPYNLAYVHLMEPNDIDLASREVLHPVLPVFRSIYQGIMMTNGGYNKGTGNDAISSGKAELVSFGKPFIANPDLPKRFALDAPLNEPNPKTFYGQGAEGAEIGYTDYPALQF